MWCRIRDYLDGWKRVIRRGIDSYRQADARLHDAREYHRARSVLADDDYMSRSIFEIPLLWGSF